MVLVKLIIFFKTQKILFKNRPDSQYIYIYILSLIYILMIADQNLQENLHNSLIFRVEGKYLSVSFQKDILELWLYEQEGQKRIKKYALSIGKQRAETKYICNPEQIYAQYFQTGNRIFKIKNKYQLCLSVQIEKKLKEISINFRDAFEENQQILLEQFNTISEIYIRRLENRNNYEVVDKDKIFNAKLAGEEVIIQFLQKKKEEIRKYVYVCRKRQDVEDQKQQQLQQLLEDGVKSFFDEYFIDKKLKFEFHSEKKEVIFYQIIIKNKKQKIHQTSITLKKVQELDRYKLYEQFTQKIMKNMEKNLNQLRKCCNFYKETIAVCFAPEKSHLQDFKISDKIIRRIKQSNREWSEICVVINPALIQNSNEGKISLSLPLKKEQVSKISDLKEEKQRKIYLKVKDIQQGDQIILYNTGQIQILKEKGIIKKSLNAERTINITYKSIRSQSQIRLQTLIDDYYSTFGGKYENCKKVSQKQSFLMSQKVEFFFGVAELHEDYQYSLTQKKAQ